MRRGRPVASGNAQKLGAIPGDPWDGDAGPSARPALGFLETTEGKIGKEDARIACHDCGALHHPHGFFCPREPSFQGRRLLGKGHAGTPVQNSYLNQSIWGQSSQLQRECFERLFVEV